MSRIDTLIAEYCPHGVEYKPLGEVGEFIRGNGLQKKDLQSEGMGAIHYGQVFTTYGTTARDTVSFVDPALGARSRRARPGDLVIATTSENDEDVCKAVAWLGNREIAVSSDAFIYRHTLDPAYAAYFFQSQHFQSQKRPFVTGTKVRRVSGTDLGRIVVPVPPLDIQRAIAAILVTMEQLETELETELEARRLQYRHYRNELLSFTGSSVEWTPLKQVGRLFRGRRFTKANVVASGLPSIHYGEIYTHYGVFARDALSQVAPALAPSLRFASTGDLVIAAVGETVEDVGKAVAWLGDDDVAIHDDCFGFRHSLDPKFVAYYFQTDRFHSEKERHVARAKVKRISADGLGQISIPVPPLDEQHRIVEALDGFEALVNDLSSGLPAEIAVRRKQYEFYRDRLLLFPERVA